MNDLWDKVFWKVYKYAKQPTHVISLVVDDSSRINDEASNVDDEAGDDGEGVH